MGWLDKLFGKVDEASSGGVSVSGTGADSALAGLEGVRFGRYSDNNKSYKKNQSWFVAEALFAEKAYAKAFEAFFDYITDEAEGSVVFVPEGQAFRFEIIQGSGKISGICDGSHIIARAPLAIMEKPAPAIMRRLLDLNFSLRYTRCALDDQQMLCMIFDAPVEMASPAKLYFGLRELAKYADRQDDLLVSDFESLRPAGDGPRQLLPPAELELKYRYFRKWIGETLETVDRLNPATFSGAIAYAFLTLIYRVDFLLAPEAGTLARLEEIGNTYWNKKDEVPIVQRNAMMREQIAGLLDMPLEVFAKGQFRTKATFAIVGVPPPEKVRENIQRANKDAQWYVENNYPDLALVINEYGMAYSQFSYSMPRLLTELITIYMAVVHDDFFRDLGMTPSFCHTTTGLPYRELITAAIDNALARWPEKYIGLAWDHSQINYNNLWAFAHSYSGQVAGLNLELKK